ncbi:proline dehydrogenase 1, mitochondrial-like [Magnolia sinica]|uniref:proline dehydrogenase 1, mitochondrial-like n=1 Tax=Magnolia sinica TaxID=86752 RepID=UPI00265B0A72|nr:proline dehydrogenase 1, mitochondrial-like [Magnolia sinica]
MAIRFSPKLLKNLRCFNSSSSIGFVGKPERSVLKPPTSLIDDLNFDNGEQLFSSVPTSQLVKSMTNLHLVAFEPAVDVGIKVMRSSLMENKYFRGVLMGIIKRSIYEHFCAGEDLEEASRTLQRLWDNGLRGILDYGLEDATDNEGCDRNLEEFLKTVETTSLLPPSSVSFACVKITAICPISLLERMSDLLRWEHKDPSFHLPWKIESLPFLSNSSPLYHTTSEPEPLTEKEEEDLKLAQQRLSKLCEKCHQTNLPLLVDAEYTSVQPAIDYFTYSAAIRFNNDENPIVYGTIQTYLRDAKERLVKAVEAAERRGISIGFKLVRGAYMTRETQLASASGAASPIHSSIQETHDCYNECTSFMLEKIAGGHGSVVLATHNLESGKAAAAKAAELKIGKGNQKLQFAQLKGMADGLSLGLRNGGFNVSKYLPFGPVENVIPYLLRRAEENRGLLSASTLDRQLMSKELKRRLKVAVMGREPDKIMT